MKNRGGILYSLFFCKEKITTSENTTLAVIKVYIKLEKIAEIGFAEADTIGTSGEKSSQVVRIEEKIANNFFTMDYGCKQEIYKNIVRKCYVFIREDSLGKGSMVFVDVTTGLIIGGECFGD